MGGLPGGLASSFAPGHVGGPPPRRGPPSVASRSGSGSDIYERLPNDYDDNEGLLNISRSDVSDEELEDSDEYHGSAGRGGKSNGSGERLVKPSQIKKTKNAGKNC